MRSFFCRGATLPLVVLFFLSVVGCNTITNRSRQDVFLRTESAGAKVLIDGKALTGQTPHFFNLVRKRKQILVLKYPNGTTQVLPLHGQYDAYLDNLIYLQAAPLAMAVDALTGTGYSYPGLSIIPSPKSLKRIKKPAPVVVIAPPLAGSELVSFNVGKAIENQLKKKHPKWRILNFSKTFPVFYRFNYRYDHQLSPQGRQQIFRHLPADYVVETRVREQIIKDPETEKKSYWWISDAVVKKFNDDNYVDQLKAQTIHEAGVEPVVSSSWWEEYFYFSPNTLAFDLGSSLPRLEVIDGNGRARKLEGSLKSSGGELMKALNFLASVGFSHWKPRTERKQWRFDTEFVPSWAANYSKIEYDNVEQLEGAEFNRLSATIGYGPRFSLSSRFGMAYLDVIPAAQYIKVDWQRGGRSGRADKWSLEWIAELGYLYYLTKRWHTRIFVKEVQENKEVWFRSFIDSSNSDLLIEQVAWQFAGFSVGYCFDSKLN